jgi:hypothetical protein
VDDRLSMKIIGFFFIETQSEIFQHILIQDYFKTFKVINSNDLFVPINIQRVNINSRVH